MNNCLLALIGKRKMEHLGRNWTNSADRTGVQNKRVKQAKCKED